jgi:Alpha/beta hydrolase family
MERFDVTGSVQNNASLAASLLGQLSAHAAEVGFKTDFIDSFMRDGKPDIDLLVKELGCLSGGDQAIASQIIAELAPQLQKLTAVEQGAFKRLLKSEIVSLGQNNSSSDAVGLKLSGWSYTRKMTVQEAQVIVRSQGLNPNAPIFIGGGGDGYFNSNVEAYSGSWKSGGNFFTHNRSGSIKNAIDAFYTLGKPVIIIGHSWGGEEALDAARYAIHRGITVDLLVTIDPVNGNGSNSSIVGMRSMRDNLGGTWVNVRATGYLTKHDGFGGDRWADLGGRMPVDHQKQADVYIESRANHGYFERMMKDANIEQMIQSIYNQKR